jgi:capsular exopolysaccharide synthesis family protein
LSFKRKKYPFSLYHDAKTINQTNMIRKNVEHLLNSEVKCLTITSAEVNDKKPLITAKLAISFAEQGGSVLLIDGNVHCPSLHKLFDLGSSEGLTDVLVNGKGRHLPINQTSYKGLHVLPAGSHFRNASTLFVSKYLDELIERWKEEYDLIIFETPEFLDETDSHILAAKCDATILVVEERKTKVDAVVKAKNMLGKARIHVLGVIWSPSH